MGQIWTAQVEEIEINVIKQAPVQVPESVDSKCRGSNLNVAACRTQSGSKKLNDRKMQQIEAAQIQAEEQPASSSQGSQPPPDAIQRPGRLIEICRDEYLDRKKRENCEIRWYLSKTIQRPAKKTGTPFQQPERCHTIPAANGMIQTHLIPDVRNEGCCFNSEQKYFSYPKRTASFLSSVILVALSDGSALAFHE